MKLSTMLICLCLLMYSCQRASEKNDESSDMNFKYVEEFKDEVLKDSLTSQILTSGDTSAYKSLARIYNLSNHEKELYYYALVMAENFNLTEAYFDLYLILSEEKNRDRKSYPLANYYLLKAYEKGRPNLDYELKRRFGKKLPVPTSAELYEKLK